MKVVKCLYYRNIFNNGKNVCGGGRVCVCKINWKKIPIVTILDVQIWGEVRQC